eukprot:Awhi_evm1s4641
MIIHNRYNNQTSFQSLNISRVKTEKTTLSVSLINNHLKKKKIDDISFVPEMDNQSHERDCFARLDDSSELSSPSLLIDEEPSQDCFGSKCSSDNEESSSDNMYTEFNNKNAGNLVVPDGCLENDIARENKAFTTRHEINDYQAAFKRKHDMIEEEENEEVKDEFDENRFRRACRPITITNARNGNLPFYTYIDHLDINNGSKRKHRPLVQYDTTQDQPVTMDKTVLNASPKKSGASSFQDENNFKRKYTLIEDGEDEESKKSVLNAVLQNKLSPKQSQLETNQVIRKDGIVSSKASIESTLPFKISKRLKKLNLTSSSLNTKGHKCGSQRLYSKSHDFWESRASFDHHTCSRNAAKASSR